MNVNELEGNLLDYWVARALGYRFWLEQRGSYRCAVVQWPGSQEPYRGSRDWEHQMQRYEEVWTFDDLKCGFFGQGPRRFSTDWEFGGPIIEREGIAVVKFYEPKDGPVTPGLEWSALSLDDSVRQDGHTPLIAAMRAYVASKYGSTVTDGEATHKPKEKTNGTP